MIEYTVRVYDNGDKYWFLNGDLNRKDGPSIEYADGTTAWYLNGKIHREDGPAVELATGEKRWFLNDEELTEEEFNYRTQPAVEISVEALEQILGYKVKIVKD